MTNWSKSRRPRSAFANSTSPKTPGGGPMWQSLSRAGDRGRATGDCCGFRSDVPQEPAHSADIHAVVRHVAAALPRCRAAARIRSRSLTARSMPLKPGPRPSAASTKRMLTLLSAMLGTAPSRVTGRSTTWPHNSAISIGSGPCSSTARKSAVTSWATLSSHPVPPAGIQLPLKSSCRSQSISRNDAIMSRGCNWQIFQCSRCASMAMRTP